MLEGIRYQNAYVTGNMNESIGISRASAKIDDLTVSEGTTQVVRPAGPAVQTQKMAFIWVGRLQYELIEPIAGSVDVYRDALPVDDGLSLHHICMRVDDWNKFRPRVDAQPCPVIPEGAATRCASSILMRDRSSAGISRMS